MSRSESIVNLSKALLKAQRNIGAAVKGAKNPFFKSNYADLGSVMEACKESLNEQGIVVLQPVGNENGVNYVETTLLHESGEYISARMALMPTKNMQELGSAVSYARRYGLQSTVFIPAEDNDAEGTMSRSDGTVYVPTPRAGGFKPKTVAAGNTVVEDDGFDD